MRRASSKKTNEKGAAWRGEKREEGGAIPQLNTTLRLSKASICIVIGQSPPHKGTLSGIWALARSSFISLLHHRTQNGNRGAMAPAQGGAFATQLPAELRYFDEKKPTRLAQEQCTVPCSYFEEPHPNEGPGSLVTLYASAGRGSSHDSPADHSEIPRLWLRKLSFPGALLRFAIPQLADEALLLLDFSLGKSLTRPRQATECNGHVNLVPRPPYSHPSSNIQVEARSLKHTQLMWNKRQAKGTKRQRKKTPRIQICSLIHIDYGHDGPPSNAETWRGGSSLCFHCQPALQQ